MMKNSALFSVVIPLYNKRNAIVRTIQSVLSQTIKDFELVVVDDGSTDDSYSVVSNLNDARIRLIHKENGGVSSARNVGIKAAVNPYVALLDGDDFWEPTFLEEQTSLIEDYPQAGMWGVNYAFVKGDKCEACYQGLGAGYRGYVEHYFETTHNDLFCSSSVVIRKDVFEKVGYFDERIASSEDLDMWYRIILNFPVVYYDKVLAYYNQNAENRVAYDTDVRFPLPKDIKYYLDKFKSDFKNNRAFSHYLNSRVAADLLSEKYYFGTPQDKKDADYVVGLLQFSDIHPKYRWIFMTPRWFGWIVYRIVSLKKAIVGR